MITRTRRSRWRGSSEVFERALGVKLSGFPAMTDADDNDHQAIILNRAHQAVIADSIFPVVAELALQAFSDLARVFQSGLSVEREILDMRRATGLVQPVKFSYRDGVEFNRPLLRARGHIVALHFRWGLYECGRTRISASPVSAI